MPSHIPDGAPLNTLAGVPATIVNGGTSYPLISIIPHVEAGPTSTSINTYLGDDGARAYRASLANRAARQNHRARPDKAIRLDCNRLPDLRARTAHPPLRVERDRRRVDADIRPDEAIVANFDLARVLDRAVPSNNHILPDADIIPVVAGKRRLDHDIVAKAAHGRNGRGDARGDLYRITRLQDLPEQPGPLQG